MKVKLSFFISLITIFSCNAGNKNTDTIEQNTTRNINKEVPLSEGLKNNIDTSKLDGVLLLHSDSADFNKTGFTILNLDKSVFTKIVSVNGEEPSSKKLKNNILAYYPDYYIIHLNAGKTSDSFYSVKVGTDIKLLTNGKYMEFLSWSDYILRFFCTTTKENSLRKKPSESGDVINDLDYNELSFRCIEISGDWVKVACNTDCEGCPVDNKDLTGWIKWRKDGKIILKQYYTC